MDACDYSKQRGEVENQISILRLKLQEIDREYRSQFPKVRDSVRYQGKQYEVHWVEQQPYVDLHYVLRDIVTNSLISDVKCSELELVSGTEYVELD